MENDIIAAIKAAQEKHLQLCSICESLNDAYSIQILIILIVLVLSLLVETFFLLHVYLTDNWGFVQRPHLYPFFLSAVIVLYTTQLFAFTYYCSSTSNEV